jgi:hypothetical protein
MILPNIDQVVVPRAKVVDYLLSQAHRDGRHKATFFLRFGFRSGNWQELAAALKQHAAVHGVTREESSPFGRRMVVEGIMHCPNGREQLVRSVWFLRSEETVPRFVTAYPLKRL